MQALNQPPGLFSRYRFTILLASLILFLIATPVIGALRSSGSMGLLSLLMNLAFVGVLVVTVLTVATGPRARWLAASMLVPIAILTTYAHFSTREGVAVFMYGVATGLLAYTIVLVLLFVFKQRRVTTDLVNAALCGYLLIGVMWALVYVQLEYYAPGSLKLPEGMGAGLDFLDERSRGSVLALYFSFVTLTTVGYGDFVPLSGFARMLAICEGIIGQFYMVVLVARLVGTHVAQLSVRADN